MLYKHYLLVFAPSLSDDKRINTLIFHAGFYNLKKQSDVQKQRKPRFRQFLHFSACVWLVQPKPSAPWIQLHPEKHATAFYTELLELEAGGDDTSPWGRPGPVTALSCCRTATAPGRNRSPTSPEHGKDEPPLGLSAVAAALHRLIQIRFKGLQRNSSHIQHARI